MSEDTSPSTVHPAGDGFWRTINGLTVLSYPLALVRRQGESGLSGLNVLETERKPHRSVYVSSSSRRAARTAALGTFLAGDAPTLSSYGVQ